MVSLDSLFSIMVFIYPGIFVFTSCGRQHLEGFFSVPSTVFVMEILRLRVHFSHAHHLSDTISCHHNYDPHLYNPKPHRSILRVFIIPHISSLCLYSTQYFRGSILAARLRDVSFVISGLFLFR